MVKGTPDKLKFTQPLKGPQEWFSPGRFLITTIGGIFLAEVIAMVLLLFYFGTLPYYLKTLIDASIMIVLIYPLIYFLSFRPLLLHIEKSRKAEEQLREMALFPALNPDAVLQVDGSGRIVGSNPSADRMGLAVGIQLSELIPDLQDLDLPDCIVAGTTQHVYEARLGERVLLWTIRGATNLGLAFLYSQDITERKRSEETIHLLSSVVEQTADTVVVTDCDGVIEYVNPALENATGYTKEEVLGKTPRILKSGVHNDRFYSELWRTILRGETFHSEITNRKKNGAIIHESKTITPLRDAYGVITHFVATGKDITDRKQAEENLLKAYDELELRVQKRTEELVVANTNLIEEIREREQIEAQLTAAMSRLEAHIDNSPLAVIEFDPGFRVIRWSKEAERMFGWSAAEVIGYPIAELHWVHEDDVEAVSEVSGDMLSGKSPRNLNINRNYRKDGALIHCEWYNSALYDAQGQLTSILAQVLDITERKHADEELHRLNRTLKALSDSNQVMMRAGSEEEYLDQVCKIVVNDCGHVMVWIGYAEDDEYKSVRPVASAGFEAGYLETLKITWDDSERGRGPTGTAIRTGKPCRCRNMLSDPQFEPWRAEALKRGYSSSIVLPLMAEGKVLGAVSIYSREPDPFSDDEERLLSELADDLAHGVTSIRLRKALAHTAESLRNARDELELRVQERTQELAVANRDLLNEITERKEIERQLRIQTAAMEAAANGILISDPFGNILWTNPALTQISGYTESDLIGQSTRIFKSGKHEEDFYLRMWATILEGKVWHGETTNKRRDGSLYVEEQTITPVLGENDEISHFIAIKQDVSERKLIQAQLEDSNRELTKLSMSERRQRMLAEGLVKSTLALNESLELDSVLDHIFEQTRRTIPYLAADVVLIEDHKARVARQWGFEEHLGTRAIYEKDDLPIDKFPIWETIFATQSIKLITDTTLEDQWNTFPGMEWIRSYLAAPLIYNSQVIGIINLGSDRENTFDQDMANSLGAFAASAAVAIQNARIYEAEQQNRKVAEILSAASTALAQTLDVQMVMETILDYVQFVMPFDVAFVVLSEGDEQFRIRAVSTTEDYGLREILLNKSIDLFSEPIVRAYFEKYESTYIPDSRGLSDWNPPPELASMRCWLGVPLESMGKVLGIVVATRTGPNSFSRNQIQLVEAVVRQAVVAMQNAWLFEQVRAGRERLQQLSRRLVEVQENERKYIARELHDESSQALTSLKMGLHVIERETTGQKSVKEHTANLITLTDEILESLHRLAANLRPASLDHLGLVEALTSLTETTGQRSGLTARFKSLGLVQRNRITEDIEASVYRIIQEALTNVIRHAKASRADVLLEWQDSKIVIIVEDDGIGFDMETARKNGRLGLAGMEERAEMLGGKLVIESTPHAGATLIVEIPYDH